MKVFDKLLAASLYGATISMELGPRKERAITHPTPIHLVHNEESPEAGHNRNMRRTLGTTALTESDPFSATDAITSHKNRSTHGRTY